MKQLLQSPRLIFLTLLLLAALACNTAAPPAPGSSTNEGVDREAIIRDAVATIDARPAGSNGNATPAAPSLIEIEATLSHIYERSSPGVVHIFNNSGITDLEGVSGTGFLIDEEGHIVTNNHVVESGSNFEVVFYDGTRYRADIVGTDIDSDLAVIQVETVPENVAPLPLGNSNEVSVGQFVVAIGNPFGEQNSMSMGIISGLGRSLRSARDTGGGGFYTLPQVLQTDAPINPGNSGGPLLNLAGEVIGVNSAILSTSGVSSGVGFSIPVNAVHRIVPSLISTGSYIYPFIGVQITSLNLLGQEEFGLPQADGAYITGISPDSPAQEAGLIGSNGAGGDMIIAINGVDVDSPDELIAYLVFETEVGETVDLTVIRNNETIQVPLTLGERP